MPKLTLSMITAVGIALSGAALLGHASARADETTGEYLDDSVITTKVKAAIAGEPSLKSLQISVRTHKNVVQLSGFVDSAQSVRRAGELAANVHGVSGVRNDLIVK